MNGMSNDNAAELVSKIRDFNFLWTDLGKVCDLIEQQAAEIKRLNQHKFDYHDTFIDAVGVAAETLGFPLNKRDYNELRGCASADGLLIELTEKVKAELDRMKSVVAENAQLRDDLNDTQCDLATARGLLRKINDADKTGYGWSSLIKPLIESPASTRPEPGAVAGNAASLSSVPRGVGEDSAKSSLAKAAAIIYQRIQHAQQVAIDALAEGSAKLTDEFRGAADIEANTPITVGTSFAHPATFPPMTGVISDIVAERVHQVAKGFDSAHDDSHDSEELVDVAWRLLLRANDPWGLYRRHEGDRRRQLVITAALIVAEIERCDRLGQPSPQPHPDHRAELDAQTVVTRHGKHLTVLTQKGCDETYTVSPGSLVGDKPTSWYACCVETLFEKDFESRESAERAAREWLVGQRWMVYRRLSAVFGMRPANDRTIALDAVARTADGRRIEMTDDSDTPKTEVEGDDAPNDGGCFVVGLWAAAGGFLYGVLFWGPRPLPMNLPQKIFISLLCGPIGWLDAIYNLLGLLGEPK